MYQFIIVVHVILGLGIIGLVMMQQGKGADAGAAFGSASSGSVFGAQGAASFLSRTTAIFATLFFVSSLGLAIMGSIENEKVDLMDSVEVEDVKADVPMVDGAAVPTATEEVPQQMIEETVQEEVAAPVAETEEATEAVQQEAAPAEQPTGSQ